MRACIYPISWIANPLLCCSTHLDEEGHVERCCRHQHAQRHAAQRVWLKMECYQPVGSYKIRGIGRLCQSYARAGVEKFVSSSGGNAGLAVAYAGRLLGMPVDVFMPKTSLPIYQSNIKLMGAQVHITGVDWDAANHTAQAYATEHQAAFIPPFDHPLIWAGHATMIDEIVADNMLPDAIVLAVGGGGLACGVLQGLHQYGLTDIPLFTVETTGAASFAESVKAGAIISLSEINTIATSLGAKRITDKLWQYTQSHPITPIIISDQEAQTACEYFAKDHRILIEPASGAALSVVYNKNPALAGFKNILVIVCGGIGIRN